MKLWNIYASHTYITHIHIYMCVCIYMYGYVYTHMPFKVNIDNGCDNSSSINNLHYKPAT